jgi:hypothetical protein
MRTKLLPFLACFTMHCSGPSGPDPNPAIATASVSPIPTNNSVTCAGPPDEIALLGSLCSFTAPAGVGLTRQGAPTWTWMNPDVAVSLGEASAPQLLIYSRATGSGDTNQASTAQLACFVDLHPGGAPIDDWRHAEAVTRARRSLRPSGSIRAAIRSRAPPISSGGIQSSTRSGWPRPGGADPGGGSVVMAPPTERSPWRCPREGTIRRRPVHAVFVDGDLR